MNREIKFRAKEKNTNKWVYGYYAMRSEESPVPETNEWYCEHYMLIDRGIIGFEEVLIDVKTLCQFTGLTDKDKKQVYEGDIDEYGYIIKWNPLHNCIGYYSSNGYIQGILSEMVDKYGNPVSYHLFRKIIGNIFDNSELVDGAVS
jgi:uncharacterized phage protein (TIGR01671 family)